jgi:hypothetical protein
LTSGHVNVAARSIAEMSIRDCEETSGHRHKDIEEEKSKKH